MKGETIQKIMVLLKEEVDIKKAALMRVIEGQNNNVGVDERIREYRIAYNSMIDFENWMDEQEEGD